MRGRKRRERGGAWGRGRGARARGPERAGLGQAGSRRGAKTHDTHSLRSESNCETKSETRLGKTHD
jgi:hypothetical protein